MFVLPWQVAPPGQGWALSHSCQHQPTLFSKRHSSPAAQSLPCWQGSPSAADPDARHDVAHSVDDRPSSAQSLPLPQSLPRRVQSFTHLPPEQVPPHDRPHPPQLLASLVVSVQAPLQLVSLPHEHVPPMQAAPVMHALPHWPQFDVLELVSTQAPAHPRNPVGQVSTHSSVVPSQKNPEGHVPSFAHGKGASPESPL